MQDMTEEPEKLTRAEYARYRGWSRKSVTKAVLDDRLVLTDDEEHVLVAASDKRYKATTTPGGGASAYHAEQRRIKAAKKPELVIIRGLPGSGKSTAAKKMSGYAHIESDTFFIVDGEYIYDQRGLTKAHNWCFREVKKSLEAGNNTVVSNTFSRVSEFRRYMSLGFPFKVITTTGEWENIHAVPEATIQKMRDRWEPYPPSENQKPSVSERPKPNISVESVTADNADDAEAAAISYTASRAVKEKYNALLAKHTYEKAAGIVVDADQVKQDAFHAGVLLRDALMRLPSQLGDILAGEDVPVDVRDILKTELIRILQSLPGEAKPE